MMTQAWPKPLVVSLSKDTTTPALALRGGQLARAVKKCKKCRFNRE